MAVSLCVAVAASALLVLLPGCAEAADKPNLVTLLVRPTVRREHHPVTAWLTDGRLDVAFRMDG